MKECVFLFQAEDGIRDVAVTGVQTCALPICKAVSATFLPGTALHARTALDGPRGSGCTSRMDRWHIPRCIRRSEEHTSELQSRLHLVCRLLLEKKKKETLSV